MLPTGYARATHEVREIGLTDVSYLREQGNSGGRRNDAMSTTVDMGHPSTHQDDLLELAGSRYRNSYWHWCSI